MKRIELTQGQFTIVDDKNYEWLNRHKWYAVWKKGMQSFYAVRNGKTKDGKKRQISMSRKILGLKCGDKRQADHINHNTLDNRELNLRIVTHQQNGFNRRGVIKGYSWHEGAKKYQARIGVDGKLIALGCFDKAKEAHNAYLEAKKLYHRI